ncbi:RAF proto-oncogene serine/threonine-protein kinase-like isoform X2 [Symsagittifera roscoffensis]|uniref:RAF proto-oncogene serine/threonine-protein kinase-like isoform X2 n=1 Tax=Symsagittifera roscoffensis TaxID=84072 RepID=UPI00307C8CAC
MSLSCVASQLNPQTFDPSSIEKIGTNYQTNTTRSNKSNRLNGSKFADPLGNYTAALNDRIISHWASSTSFAMSSHSMQTPSGSQSSNGTSSFIKINLPGGMHTYIQPRCKLLLRDALDRKLSTRNMKIEMCSVYRVENGVKHFVDWATDIDLLKNEDYLSIEFRDQYKEFGVLKQTHDIATKRIILSNCCVCRQTIVLEGYICKSCGLKCHKLCGEKLPDECKKDNVDLHNGSHRLSRTPADKVPTDNNRKQRRANAIDTSVENNNNSPSNVSSPFRNGVSSASPDSKQRTRSTSEPNVSVNNVNNPQPSTSRTPPSDSQISVTNKSPNKSSQYYLPTSGNTLSLPRNAARETQSAGHIRKSKSPGGTRARQKGNNVTPVDIKGGANKVGNANSTDNIHEIKSVNAGSLGRDLLDGRLGRRNNEIWAIPSSELVIDSRIGSGSFGTVYKGKYHGPVAIKKLNLTSPTKEQLASFENEVLLLKKCRNSHILSFYGFTTDNFLAIVTQWCEGKSLYWHIHVEDSENPDKYLNNYEKLRIAMQTAQGMSYLHSKNIIHRDLKSNNIFLLDDYDFTVKIGDFGLATLKSKWNNTGQEKQPTGSILWMAPEVLIFNSDNPYSYKSDVYSFGIVLFELFSGKLPYNGLQRDVIIYMVGKGFLKPDLSQCQEDTPADLKQLLIECVQKNTDGRPDFKKVEEQLKQLLDAQPKIERSNSAPLLTRIRTGTIADNEGSFYPLKAVNSSPSPNPARYMEHIFFPQTDEVAEGEV